jgi:adenylate kinase
MALSSPRPRLAILLVAAQSAAKDKLVRRITKMQHVPYISIRDILRTKNRPGGVAVNVQSFVSFGELRSDTAATTLLRARLEQPDVANGFVLEGFPLTETQAREFDAIRSKLGIPRLVVLKINVSPSQWLKHVPRYDKGRYDLESAERRLEDHAITTQFIVEHYSSCVVEIDGTGTEEDLWQRVKRALEYQPSQT